MESQFHEKFPFGICYAVLPPGHGKSFLHAKYTYFFEADSIFNCKGSSELVRLRSVAKYTGNWREYDEHWMDLVKSHLERLILPTVKEPICILVPADSVGLMVSPICIFRGVLGAKQWSVNLRNRKGDINKYHIYWSAVLEAGAGIYEKNEELESSILRAYNKWICSILE